MEEEDGFSQILDHYMQLFQSLWSAFAHSFQDFWEAWWSAMDILLPCPETERGSKREGNPTTEYFGPDEGYGPHVDLIRSIVGHHSKFLSSMLKFAKLTTNQEVLRTWILHLNDASIGIPFSFYHLEKIFTLSEDQLQELRKEYFGVDELLDMPQPKRLQEENDYIREQLIPIMVPTIILDIHLGRQIPADLRQHLETEGIIQDGRLARPAFKEIPEDIFSDSMDTLFC